MESREIEQRIEWINERVPLDGVQKSYIRFQMQEQTKALTDEIEELKQDLFNIKMESSHEVADLVKTNQETQKELDETFHKLEGYIEHNKQLQSRISELENKVLESIQPALKYFNGFDSPDQNEAAFHGLNNLNNYVTNNPKTN